MKKPMFKIVSLLAAAMLLVGCVCGVSAAPAENEEVTTLPLKSWYTAPAETWESDALPIGNGFIGGMIFGGVDSDHIQVNENTLWSGGPGANPNYNFGINTKSEDAKKSLNQLRQKLQDLCTDFTKNKSSYLDANGKVVAYDFSYGSAATEIANLQKPLYGSRGVFGFYQSLGDIYISDPSKETPILDNATSTAEPSTTGTGERATNLFDGSTGSKWFAGNTGTTLTYPVSILWNYTAPYETGGYKVTSANDMEGRDPNKWVLYGSNDGVTYTEIDRRESVSFAGRGVTNSYSLSKTVKYRYFKLDILSTKQNLPPQLAEISLNAPRKSGSTYENYQRWLDISGSVAGVSYDVDGVTYTREYFASYPDNVMVIRLTASQKGSLSRTVTVNSEQPHKTITAQGDTITMVGQPSDHRATGLQFAEQIKVVPTGGTMSVSGKAITVDGADEILLIMAASTNYQQVTDGSTNYFAEKPPVETTTARITAAAKKGYAALLEAHQADYKELFDRVKIDIGATEVPTISTDKLLFGYQNGRLSDSDSRYLETMYYQFGRYLLISSSREGSLPANLQGIWAEGLNPPWNCDYHTNINLQMNYWLAEQTNLSECHTPLFEYINSLVKTGELFANFYFAKEDGSDVRGWGIACGCNIWNHIGSNDSEIGLVPAGSAWLCQHLWEHYRFTLDKDFLKANYNTILGSALFCLDNLWTDQRDGTLVVNPSYSPENGGLSIGTAYDQSITWEIFNTVIEASKVLGYEDTAEVKEIKAAMGKLSNPLRIGLAGQLMEWKDETKGDTTGSGQHRHVSQLFGLCPGTLVVAGRSDEDDQYIEAMKTTLRLRGDGGTGWSKAWKINFWARLRDGDHAQTMVNQILKESTMMNLFDTHPPFQIDGNFGATAGMTEMLLQSQGDSIDLLAALPSAWADGSVSGLKARGDFTVSMEWAGQLLTGATVVSGSGTDCTLNYPGLAKATVKTAEGKAVETTVVDKSTITFATKAGETYVLSEIPQEKKVPNQIKILRTYFNNLYTDALVQAAGLEDNDGAYVESFDNQPAGPKAGLEAGDVVRAFNGEKVISTADLLEKYEAVDAYKPITLTVWRGGRTFDTTFTKMELAAKNDDLYHVLPGRIWAGGYKALYDGAKETRIDDARAIKGSGSAVFYNLMLHGKATSAQLAAAVNGKGTVTVYLGENEDGDMVAKFDLTDTAGKVKTFDGSIVSMENFEDTSDLYVVLEGDITLSWFELTSGGLLGDVDSDGKITTTDARLTLQYAAKKIGENALNTGVADVDGDGKFTTTDARLILQKAAKKISKFPAEK